MGPYVQELTISSPYVHSRIDSNTFTMGNPARVDLNPMPESYLSPSKWLRIWPFGLRVRSTPKRMPSSPPWQVENNAKALVVRKAPQVIRTKGSKIDTKTVESAQILSMIHFLESKSHISDANCTLHFFTSKAPLPFNLCPPNIKCFF